MQWNRLRLESRGVRYLSAVVLGNAGQMAIFAFVTPASAPLILSAPFIVGSSLIGGLCPDLVATMLCAFEAARLALEPVGSFLAYARDWNRLGALVLTGVVASFFPERLRRSGAQLAAAHRDFIGMLESIHDGFNAFDCEWR